MAKRKIIPVSDYSDWSILRTIKEAENVSKWNPWLAHLWMSEALNGIDLDNPYYNEFDLAAARINSFWATIKNFNWYNEEDFWGAIDRPTTCTYIQSTNGSINFIDNVDNFSLKK